MRSLILKYIAVSLAVCGICAGARADEDVARELARRREAVVDFYKRLEAQEAEARRLQQAAGEMREIRERDARALEQARQEYIRTRPRYDSEAEERRDRMAERELKRQEEERDLLQDAFIRERNRTRDLLRAGPMIDEMKEYELE